MQLLAAEVLGDLHNVVGGQTELLRKTCDLTPGGIIRKLELRRPIYGKTAMEGHFGVADRPWEQTDIAQELKRLANI